MKLSLTLLATASYCAPERKIQKKPTNERFIGRRRAPISCSKPDELGDGGSPFTSIDNGQSGQVTFESYTNWADCYVDIGSSCGANGLQVEITHMEIEVRLDYTYENDQYYWNYDGCADNIHFSWLNNDGETVEQTDPQCGCLEENHPSCTDHPIVDYYYGNDVVLVTEKPAQYNLVGTDVKIILQSDGGTSGGKIQVDWKCNIPKTTTNTLETAEALLKRNFTPEMGRDYGCAGRGLFDPFAHTIGSHVDEVDAAFFVWKKCVQCASGNDKSNILSYSYDVKSDTCADGPSRSYCECDRTLMKFLIESDVTDYATDYPAEQCVPGTTNSLKCCQYNTHFWAHYNPERSCCGPDGIKTLGSC